MALLDPLSIVYAYRIGPWRAAGRLPQVVTTIESAGHRVRMTADGPLDARADEVLVLHGNANWFPRLCAALAATPPDRRPFTVIRHYEPLPPPAAAGLPPRRRHLREWAKVALRDPRATDPATNLGRLRRLAAHGIPDLLTVATELWRDGLHERGIHAVALHEGPGGEAGRLLPGVERDIDVLFVGARDVPRRNRVIARMRSEGVDVTVAGGWSRDGVWGEDRTRLINRAKVFLNVARHPGDLSGHRLALGMLNGACVLSETLVTPAPYVPGVHFATAAPGELAGAARRLLGDDTERERLARAGHELVTTAHTLERSTARLLALVADGVAARRGAWRATPPSALR